MTDAVVERTARAECEALGIDPDQWDEINGERVHAWEKVAFGTQHVLSALRPGDRLPGGLVVVPEEATEGMATAFMGYDDPKRAEWAENPTDIDEWYGDLSDFRKAYTAMIAAAGKEG